MNSSDASRPDFLPVSTLKNFRKKTSRQYSQVPERPPVQQRYWNEYDNPESEDDEGYYIYINPDEEFKFPGQETVEKWVQTTRRFLHLGRKSETNPLLSVLGSATTDDETVDESVNPSSMNYGTMGSCTHPASGGYFTSIFRSLRRQDAQTIQSLRRQSERERQSLVSVIEARQHAREMTKLRLYVTCITAALVIDIILTFLTFTSRRKERGVVDGVILFGTISNLLMLATAVLSMKTRRERLGWIHQGTVFIGVLVVVMVDILLLRWVLSP